MAAKYYKKTKEILQRKTRKNNQNLSEEEKIKKRQYAHERYRNCFIENELNEEVKNEKRQYTCNLYKTLSKVELFLSI